SSAASLLDGEVELKFLGDVTRKLRHQPIVPIPPEQRGGPEVVRLGRPGNSSVTLIRSWPKPPKSMLPLRVDVIQSLPASALIVWLSAVARSRSFPTLGVVENAIVEIPLLQAGAWFPQTRSVNDS
ncbi:hypothetical protein CNY89_20845, partial [Amaricoccus sp. HAR-UPW-R2A-40]